MSREEKKKLAAVGPNSKFQPRNSRREKIPNSNQEIPKKIQYPKINLQTQISRP
jgi:hypothetical protein